MITNIINIINIFLIRLPLLLLLFSMVGVMCFTLVIPPCSHVARHKGIKCNIFNTGLSGL